MSDYHVYENQGKSIHLEKVALKDLPEEDVYFINVELPRREKFGLIKKVELTGRH